MARKQTRVVREFIEDLPPEGAPPDAIALDPDAQREAELQAAEVSPDDIDDVFRVTDEMRTASGIRLQFVRVLPLDRAGYVAEMAPAEFTLDRVRKLFGPGTYRCRVLGSKGYVPGGGKVVIAEMLDPAAGPTSSVEDVLAILKADKEKNSEQLKSWATILLPALAPVIASWLTPRNQVAELIAGVAQLQGLNKQKEPESLSEQVEKLLGVMTRLKEASTDDKPVVGSTWVDVIREMAGQARPLLEGIISQRQGAMPGRVGVPPSAMLQAPMPQPASVPTPQPSGDDAMLALLQWLSGTLQQLVLQAAKNKDPELYAEVVLDNVPESADLAQLRSFIDKEDWWKQLQQFQPAVAPYQGWFTQFREALLELLDDRGVTKPVDEKKTDAEETERHT